MIEPAEPTSEAQELEPHATLGFRHENDSLAMAIEHIPDESNDAVILAKFLASNLGPLLHIAKQQRADLMAARKEGFVEANTRTVIETAARRIVGPDNKLLS